MRRSRKGRRILGIPRKIRWRLASLAVAGPALALLLAGVAASPASAAVESAALPTSASAAAHTRHHTLPRGVPRADVRVQDIVVIHPATSAHPASLGRVTAVSERAGRVVVAYVPVSSDALRPFHAKVHVKGGRRSILLGGASAGGASAMLTTSGSSETRQPVGCADLTGSVSFEPSAGGSMGVTWVDVWAGIVWAPEISGSISLSPNISVQLAGTNFSGGCYATYSPEPVTLGEIETPAGPLGLCFGASAQLGANVQGSLSQSITGYVSGSIGTNYHFGVTGVGLSPFDSVSPGASVTPGQQWIGSAYVRFGPYLAANYVSCDEGAGVNAGLYNTLSLNGTASGWNVTNTQSINVGVDLDILGYTFSQSVANWGLTSVRLISGSW